MSAGIKDVARVANVSPATVSRALSGQPVNPAMHARVLDAVRMVGYRPNLAARRLRSRHTNTISLIVADIGNPFFTAVARIVEDAAYARGMRLILCNTDEDPAKEAMYLELMQEERVAGIILAPTRTGLENAARTAAECPMVLIDRTARDIAHDCVVLDNEAMAARLVDHLHAAGFAHIGGLFGADSITGTERRAGFEWAARRLGLRAEAVAVPHGPGEAARCVTALLSGSTRPQALVASNGPMLLEVLHGVRALGLSIPHDIALTGFDRADWMAFVAGGLTVIEQPVEEIGRVAMSMLFDRIDQPHAPARKVVLAGTMVVGGSSDRASQPVRQA